MTGKSIPERNQHELHCNKQDVRQIKERNNIYNVWFQKISIPQPQRVIENSEGKGGLKGQNFLRNV